ncbi:iron(III) transport system substrate-binding protein [Modicisalibacter xianhensis]|uniref:Iron(III) transport system substrate-binding protein n=1 Tax=Modicisalibacter xianhensis TaxID=442341 RepID=A0A4R8G841_9GAMM|nr:Fe(3+) ABC transporter substrate-binding protein [Halomonas xianhensis]TDX32398.1 iron(III) transport system substrate-binding protein [Halomonas xianhensis]
MPLFKKVLVTAVAVSAGLGSSLSLAQEEVNIYSYRQPFLIEPFLKEFTAETGIETNIIFGDQGLTERLKREGRNSPADVILTVDIGRLQELVDAGVTQPIEDETIMANIPEQYFGENNQWVGLTSRARVFFTSVERMEPGEIKTYEDLADPRFEGRICTRPGDDAYNVALIASMIAEHGEEYTKEWLEGFKSNLARKPQGNDRAQVKAIRDGVCDVAIGNTYYYGKMMEDEEQRSWAESARIEFPNQEGRGTHVNISGMALAKHAPNEDNAYKLMRFLTEETAQSMYANVNYEHPLNPEVAPSDAVAAWGEFKADDVPLSKVAELRRRATELVNEVGFNN